MKQNSGVNLLLHISGHLYKLKVKVLAIYFIIDWFGYTYTGINFIILRFKSTLTQCQYNVQYLTQNHSFILYLFIDFSAELFIREAGKRYSYSSHKGSLD